jgi:hypothetical protein
LPLVDDLEFMPKNKYDGHYKVSNRYAVFYSSTFDNVQLMNIKRKDNTSISSEANKKIQELFCLQRLDKEKADAVLLKFANAVDESKIY